MTHTLEQVIAKYVELRDRNKEIEKRAEEEAAPLKEAMKGLEAWVLAKMASDGVDSYKTAEGTAYKLNRTSVTTADPAMFEEYIFAPVVKAVANVLMTHGIAFDGLEESVRLTVMQSALWGLVDFRPGKKGIEELVQEKNVVPPGLNYSSTTTIGVRRA